MIAGLKRSAFVIPGVAAALFPKVFCPLCWPAYAGVLSALGIAFIPSAAYLFPLTVGFLLIAQAALWFRNRRRRGPGPFVLGLIASAVVVVGKFALESNPFLYVGVALLVSASIWNAWPRRVAAVASCPIGAPARNDSTKESAEGSLS